MTKTPEITIGVPCYNEEKTIPQTLQAILDQKDVSDFEIIVCVNGCTDRTEEIVARTARAHPNLKLIRSPRGKPNAWNLIRREATGRYIMFVDADVILSERAVFLLRKKLENDPRLAAAACVPTALRDGRSLYKWFFPHECGEPSLLRGTGYMIDNLKTSGRFRMNGLEEMPGDIISDDTWLSCVIGRGNFAFEPDAAGYYLPESSFKELIDRSISGWMGWIQLSKEYPALKAQLLSSRSRFGGMLRTWRNQEKLGDKILFPLVKPFFVLAARLCALRARSLYTHRLHTNHWRPSAKTKDGSRLASLVRKTVSSKREM